MYRLDNRTYIVLLVIATVFWFIFNKLIQIHLFVLVNGLLLIGIGEITRAFKFLITYLTLVLIASFFAGKVALMYIVLNMLARSIPLLMIVVCILLSNVSRLMASLQELQVPKNVLVMICIMVRFFPVINREIKFIKDGMRARGLFDNLISYIKAPYLAYECYMVPILIRCIKLSDELGATSELRGLSSDVKRTCIYQIHVGIKDIVAVSAYLIVMLLIYCGV